MKFDYSQIVFKKVISDWEYFPNLIEDYRPTVWRTVGEIDNEPVVYLDYFTKEDFFYIVRGWTKKEYRRLGLMTYLGEYLHNQIVSDPSNNFKGIIYVNAKDNVRFFYENDAKRFEDLDIFLFDSPSSPEVIIRDDDDK